MEKERKHCTATDPHCWWNKLAHAIPAAWGGRQAFALPYAAVDSGKDWSDLHLMKTLRLIFPLAGCWPSEALCQ